MSDTLIKRTQANEPLWRVLENFQRNQDDFSDLKTVCVVSGSVGCGKTTFLLNYFKGKKFFYFSFAAFQSELAEKLLAESVSSKCGVSVSCWADAFKALSNEYKFILLDDVGFIAGNKHFQEAFYANMLTDIHTRPFVVLITQSTDEISGLADTYVETNLDYFSIPEVKKLYPALSKAALLGLCALSGGIPKLLQSYDVQLGFESNLRKWLNPESAFIKLMPILMLKCFRRPENYHHILCAMANGNIRVGQIGKFTGFTLNKCDNYLAGLIDNGFVTKEKVAGKNGMEKSVYRIANSYYLLWHKYIFPNRSAIQLQDEQLMSQVIENISETEIHRFHLRKAFKWMDAIFQDKLKMTFRSLNGITYSPRVVKDGRFQYFFDAIARHKQRVLFIKVFQSPLESCTKTELTRLQHAVSQINEYEDSHVYIFTKRRLSDYAVSQAAKDDVLNLVEVERLKY
ncbi:MAG: hypothetical protein FWF98_01230 [Dehalococcoidia bacterium]|nr:hypothetical protein [Dehalococcoidia bacterium]